MDHPGRPAQLHFRVPLSRHAGCIQALRLANERARIAQGWVEVCVVLTDLEQVQVARAIADTLLPLEAEGAEASGGGQRITLARLAGILDCYAKSFAVSDYRAHCWAPHLRFLGDRTPLTFQVGSTQPATSPPRMTFFPCQYAAPAAHLITPEHPASLRTQVEQALVSYECAWCPRLRDLDHWELLHGVKECPDHA